MLNGQESAGNAENLSLAKFIQLKGDTLLERVRSFSDYYRASSAEGRALYCREIAGPSESRARVRDLRTGAVREMVMLGSNNYLGLATRPEVREAVKRAVELYGAGMGGPPLLNGMGSLHRELERKLALWKSGSPEEYDAMLFASGYQANLGWVTGLLRDDDVLLYDELNHASLYDGIAMAMSASRARAFRFRHNDCAHLESLLARFSGKKSQIYVAVEGVYSMDGDLAPLPEVAALCRKFGAILIVDDAHGAGVMGAAGSGTAEHFGLRGEVDIAMGTFSKSFGVTGGFLVARREVIDYLRFFSRSYMFSAHLPVTTVAAVLAGLDVIAREPALLRRLHDNAAYLQKGLQFLGFDVPRGAAILPVHIPPRIDLREMSRRFDEEGIFLNSIEYPAVPQDQQRLRLSVMATHTREDLDLAIAVFRKIKDEFGL